MRLLFPLLVLILSVSVAAQLLSSLSDRRAELAVDATDGLETERGKASAQPPSGEPTRPTVPVEALGEIWRRPLFFADRRVSRPQASASPSPASPEPPAPSRPPEPPPVSFRLMGVLRDGGAWSALVAVGRDPPVWLRQGEQLNGWTIENVTAGSARLRREGTTREVKLHPD